MENVSQKITLKILQTMTTKIVTGMFLDANNMNGEIMENFLLPLNTFDFLESEVEDILNDPTNSNVRYTLVDLHYPEELYDLHRDFLLAQTK